MKKVLLISSDSNLSGASLCLLYQAKEMIKNNYKVVFIIPSAGDIEEELKKENIDYYIVKSYGWTVKLQHNNPLEYIIDYIKIFVKLLLNISAINKIKKIITNNQIDILHNNTLYSYVGLLAGYKKKIKVVTHLREFLDVGQGDKFAFRKFSIKTISKANTLICVSNSVYNYYKKILPAEKMKVVYDGIDTNSFKPFKKEILKQNTYRFIIAGTIHKNKGQLELIEALNLLKKSGIKNFSLRMMGYVAEPEYLKILQKRIDEYKLNQQIEYIGLSRNIDKEMEWADIAFMCSNYEAFGRVTVESILKSCLVIGADTSGTKEIIQNRVTRLLYKKGDINNLYETIAMALNNKKMSNDIVQNSIYLIAEKFSAKNNYEGINKIYNNL